MYGPTTITTKGQVTLPQDLRLALAVQTGDLAIFESVNFEDKTATVKIIPTQNIIDDLYGSLKTDVKYKGLDWEMKMAQKALAKKYGK